MHRQRDRSECLQKSECMPERKDMDNSHNSEMTRIAFKTDNMDPISCSSSASQAFLVHPGEFPVCSAVLQRSPRDQNNVFSLAMYC